jgi:FlaA1/EpsC-like NDP-sugar epimerase
MKKDYLKEMFNLEGKSVLITGAAGQIGRELCMVYECFIL